MNGISLVTMFILLMISKFKNKNNNTKKISAISYRPRYDFSKMNLSPIFTGLTYKMRNLKDVQVYK